MHRDAATLAILRPTTRLTTQASQVFASAELAGLKDGTRVTAALVAVDVTVADGTRFKNVQMATADVESPGASGVFAFRFRPPAKGWPAGRYAVSLSIDGSPLDTLTLSLKGPAARPAKQVHPPAPAVASPQAGQPELPPPSQEASPSPGGETRLR